MTAIPELDDFLGDPDPAIDGGEPFIISGDGPTLVLLHGWGATAQSVRALGEQVADAGYQVIAPLLAGHGVSATDLDSVDAITWIEQIIGIVKTVGGTRPVSIAGTSLGGLVALAVAGILPERVASVTAINSGLSFRRPDFVSASITGDNGVMLDADRFGPMTMRSDVHELGYGQTALPTSSFLQLLTLMKIVEEVAPRATMPALLTQSREDQVFPFGSAERIRDLLGATRVDVLDLERSFHAAHIDHDLDVISEKLVMFLDEHTGSA